ncbi:MAG: hypothetical protein WBA23_11895 [Tunicatimonas sp.]|uniref:hypothetical protein n=1 Tax=Tunicatimonas sp. TaxID=1940096 RepID=UPI003C731133
MTRRILNSVYAKPLALLLVASMLSLSFKMNNVAEVVLKAGTSIPLETVSMIQSDLITVGQTIDFVVSRDVEVNERIVIPSGSLAKGQVIRAQQPRAIGKEGFFEIRIKSVVAVDGQEVFLTGGNVYQEGEDKQTLSIVLGVFLCILFLLIKGKNAQVPPGFQIDASVASTTTIET